MSRKVDFDGPKPTHPLVVGDEQKNLIQKIQALETEAHVLGLHVTGHALNRAKNALGWEIAGDLVEAGRAAKRDA